MIASDYEVDPDYSVRVGPSGKRWDDPTMTEDEFIRDYKGRYPKTSLSDDELKQYFKDGKRFNPETGSLAKPIRPIEPTGTRVLPTEGEAFEAWNGYRRGDKSKLPCFPAGTLVKTLLGDRVIEEIAESDMVFAHDFESHCLVVRPVTAVYKNWTQHIVVVDTDRGKLSSTRSHPYWVESEDGWLPAVKLRKGMMLRLIDGKLLTVHSVETYAAEENTYNFEVDQQHNYFVGSSGVLVHNGDGISSDFETLGTNFTDIYEVTDVNTSKVVYVGQSVQGVDARLLQHVNDPKSALYVPKDSPLRQAPNFPKNVYRPTSVAADNWTSYEAAVWEQHYIDKNGGKGTLLNRQEAITPEKFEKYRKLHNPCI
jgi:hypothetical protein